MVYLFLADGFEEVEALTQVDYLRRAGVYVTTVGVTGEYVTGTRGITVKADALLENTAFCGDVEMIILPGGLGGVNNMKASAKVVETIKCAANNGKYIAAICAAPTILAELGLLRGKKCICYPDMTDILIEHGGLCEDKAVVRDGNFITSKSAGTAEQFALSLIEILCGKDASEKVRHSIYARNPKE